MMMKMLIPFYLVTSNSSYFLTLSLQLILLVMGSVGLAAADGVFMMYVANLIGYVEVFKHECNELNEMLFDQKKEKSSENRSQIREKMRHIELQHQDIIE